MPGNDWSRPHQKTLEPAPQPVDHDLAVRPVGVWVIAGFLLFSILTMWGLVSYIFAYRS
ncbi:hypothetical protein [Acidiphilium acidophilum]|uniref:hypothetical protein n=1 Tax=Acidiphilium acidophilum TaxID=76588 RepID=UPI002E8E7798|nr:hypothetical protein [Acidiphilium acidophilum]